MLYGAFFTHLLPIFILTATSLFAAYLIYRAFFARLNTKSDEAEALVRLHLATAEALATAIDAKDQTTHCHVRRVQIYAAGMGEVFSLSKAEIDALKAGALLHDIGKLAVPPHILNKPSPLTPAEFDKMKIHTVVGAQLLSRVDFPYPVIPIVRHHHEQWDGNGYPDRLKAEQIPITARIFSVVDCFDSVREDRPFRRGMTLDEGTALLVRGSGVHFDPHVVDLFIKHLPRFDQQITERGLQQQATTNTPRELIKPSEVDLAQTRERGAYMAYDQIKNAHREVYALYEIARTFGTSLDVEHTLEGALRKIVAGVQTCRCCQHAQMVAAPAQQALEQPVVETARVLKRLGHALVAIEIEAETGAAERQVEVGQDDVRTVDPRHARRDIVGDRRRADAAPCADEG